MKNIYLLFIVIFLIGTIAGYLVFDFKLDPDLKDFKELNPEDLRQRIIKERDYGISQAVMAGLYRCCISPPCSMCYMEANQWNYGKVGACACDDFIAKSEAPCPQCQKAMVKDTGQSCEFIENCEETNL